VVYFEPFDDFGSSTPLSTSAGVPMPHNCSKGKEIHTARKQMPVQESTRIRPEVSLVRNSIGPSIVTNVLVKEEHENHVTAKMNRNDLDIGLSLEQPFLASKPNCMDVNRCNHTHEKENHNTASIAIDEQGIKDDTRKMERSFLDHDSKLVSRREEEVSDGIAGDDGMCASNSEYLNQVHKIWVSSHDPVILPGRGTLHFKCFGVLFIFGNNQFYLFYLLLSFSDICFSVYFLEQRLGEWKSFYFSRKSTIL
jgi:hypothetical protein